MKSAVTTMMLLPFPLIIVRWTSQLRLSVLGVLLALLPVVRPYPAQAQLRVAAAQVAAVRETPDEGCTGMQELPIDLAAALSKRDRRVQHVWGESNSEMGAPELGTRGPVLHIAYPEGSIDPGNTSAPRGGAGFELRENAGAARGCLTYRVRFPQGFKFVKGGKLPGLFGGDAPRGCTPEETSRGFSARLMWRADGAGELYLYAPGRSTRCGESIGRGGWTFQPGTWTAIAEEVVVNTPGISDGAVRIWIDGQLVISRDDLILRERTDVGVDGLLFSTFFGGKDPSWASPTLQHVEFADFTLSLQKARPHLGEQSD